MGEVSGEIVSPVQPTETKEEAPNFGLSVNGSQIIALANLNYLEEHGFSHPAKPNLLDRVKTLRYRPAYQRLTAIKELVLAGKTQEAINLLQHGITLADPIAGVKNNRLVEGTKAIEAYKKETIDALSKDIPAEEAFKDHLKFNKVFREFIRSLPGKALYELPKESTRVFLTQLGIEAYVYPKSNTLNLSPGDILLNGRADLPADQQHPFYLEEKEVFGEENNETTIARLEIFTELAKKYPKVFTHITASVFLPTILKSGYIGKPYEKGYKGQISSERGEVFVETLTFRDASKYAEAIQQLKTDGKIIVPAELSEEKKTNYPLHELVYVSPDNINPIAIFSDKFSQKHNLQGWLADDVADIKDECLIGILVTPQYKQHLLHWISTWTDAKRQEVFGDRKPEEVLISSVKDLPPLEIAYAVLNPRT